MNHTLSHTHWCYPKMYACKYIGCPKRSLYILVFICLCIEIYIYIYILYILPDLGTFKTERERKEKTKRN